MCARLITIPVVRRVVTTIFMAILLCSLMHVTLEKSFRNQAVTRVETWKPILSLAYLSLSPINDLVSSEWVPVGFLMLGFPVAQMQLDFSGVFESVPLHHVFQVPLDILS